MKHKLLLLTSVLSIALSIGPDAHAQWVKTYTPPYDGVWHFNCFTAIGSDIFAGTEYGARGVFLSTDGGTSWSEDTAAIRDVNTFATIGTILFAGGDGVFLSSDNGATWNTAGLSNDLVNSLAVIGTNLFASTEVGVFRSTDNGNNWVTLDIGRLGNVGVLAVGDTNSSTIFGGSDSGVFLSINDDSSWTLVDSGLTMQVNSTVDALTAIGTNLFAGIDGYNVGAVFLSTNTGSDWTAIDKGLPYDSDNLEYYSVTALASFGSNLFAGVGRDGFTFFDNFGVFLSTDNGTTWNSISDGLFMKTAVTALAVIDTDIFMSNDSGGIWRRPLSDFGISAVAQTPPSPPQIQSYPNPFSQSTTVTFSSQTAGFAEVTVVNLLGAQVAQLFSGELSAGEHSFPWNASGMAPGMYECVVRMNGQVQRVGMMRSEP